MIVTHTMPSEIRGRYRFQEFLRDGLMWKLFEKFVLNFLAKEQVVYAVNSEKLNWPAEAISPEREDDLSFLPDMITDVSLRSSQRTIVIDTKYYPEALRSKHSGSQKKAISGNLYQMNSYLSSLEGKGYPDNEAEGILLYPTNGYDVDLAWSIRGHTVRVRTLDLGQNWRDIHRNLLDVVGLERLPSVAC